MAPPGQGKHRERHARSKKGENPTPQGQAPPKPIDTVTLQPYSLPLESQQIILNNFNIAFPIIQDPEHLRQVIQQVKGHLFNRNFSQAFGQPAYLEAYALRWSAARALGYSQILSDPKRRGLLTSSAGPHLTGDEPTDEQAVDPTHPRLGSEVPVSVPVPGSALGDLSSYTKVVCIGGGAGAEVTALAATHRILDLATPLRIIAVDNADWSDPISKLNTALSSPPPLPSHANGSLKARPENRPMIQDPSTVGVTFLHQDVLSWPLESLQEIMRNTTLCTVMFTLNELFGSSLPKTTALLLHLTDSMARGSHLLVIDSPGSYSEISLGKVKNDDGGTPTSTSTATATKKYPMKWLLDHTLLEVATQDQQVQWVKIESEDSLWFRIDQRDRERLKYAVELENMRYQLHLYRRE